MLDKEDKSVPSVIGMYTSKVLNSQRKIAMEVCVGLEPKEENRLNLGLKGGELYDAGVRAAYTALCLIPTVGREQIDSRQVRSLRKGMEEFLNEKGNTG